jgi:hypothetical protein
VPGGCLHGIVIGEFHRGKVEVPVSMPGVDLWAKSLLHYPVDALGLAVGLGVEGGGEGEFCTEEPEKSTPKVRGKSGISV